VGILVDALSDSYQWSILRGALDAANKLGANVLCFQSGVLHGGDTDADGGLLSLIGPGSVDGLVVLAGALSNEVGPNALGAICERFRPLPICFVAAEVPGFSSVSVDNHVGAREVLGHLVVHHGIRRVAFVRGPEANAEAERRFAAYRDVLAATSIPFDPALVVAGDFTPDAGRRAVATLLDERARQTTDLEAIACANDGMALGVLEALEHRSVRVPDQIAVVGFDDVSESRFTTPPLTTARQPLERQGRDAVHLVLERPDHARVEKLVLSTELCVRRSCGCFSRRGAATPPAQPASLGMEAMLMGRREIILADLARAARGAFSAAGAGWEARLVAAFTAELSAGTRSVQTAEAPLPTGVPRATGGRGGRVPTSTRGFVETYDDLLRRLVVVGIDPAICYDVVATLRRHLLRCLGADRREQALTEALLEQVGELTGTVMERVQAWQRIDAQRRARTLSRAGAAATSVLRDGDMRRAMGEHLAALGVESCFVAVLDPPPSAWASASGARRAARLELMYDARTGVAPPTDAPYYWADEVLPHGYVPARREAAYAVAELPSYGDDTVLLIVDLGQTEGHVYEALRHLFASCLGTARLATELSQERRRAKLLADELADTKRRLSSAAAARSSLVATLARRRAALPPGAVADELWALQEMLESEPDDRALVTTTARPSQPPPSASTLPPGGSR
jgi:DNA-binding LacI/PurR family transcriptional regulator